MVYSPTQSSTDILFHGCSNNDNEIATSRSGPLSPSSQNCGMQDRLIIHQHPATSFSWSDFPVIQQQEYHPFPTSSATSRDAFLPKATTDEDHDDDTERISASLFYIDSSTESTSSIVSDDASLCSCSSSITTSESIPAQQKSPNHRKRIQFSSTIEVRTYSIVLGDHPLCPTLPIELGWEYNPEPAWVDLDTHEDYKSTSMSIVHRRSYMERRELLKTVANMSEEEIRTIEGRNMKASAPPTTPCKFSTSHSNLLALLEQPPQRRTCAV